MDHERAGVDVADRVDEADDPARAAQVETVEGLAQRREVEEGVAGQHVGPIEQPAVEVALLLGGRVQLVPGVGPPPRRAQPGQAELGAVALASAASASSCADVVARHDDADLEAARSPRRPGAPWRPRAAAKLPSPRTASFASAVAPSMLTWTST